MVRGVDVVISEACFIAMTKDPMMSRGATCATDHSVIAVRTLTPRFVQIFTSYANADQGKEITRSCKASTTLWMVSAYWQKDRYYK